jgi:hypothetical protein
MSLERAASPARRVLAEFLVRLGLLEKGTESMQSQFNFRLSGDIPLSIAERRLHVLERDVRRALQIPAVPDRALRADLLREIKDGWKRVLQEPSSDALSKRAGEAHALALRDHAERNGAAYGAHCLLWQYWLGVSVLYRSACSLSIRSKKLVREIESFLGEPALSKTPMQEMDARP